MAPGAEHEIPGVESLVRAEGVEPLPIPVESCVEVIGYGCLTRLVDARGDSALQLRERAPGLRTYIDDLVAELPVRGLMIVR